MKKFIYPYILIFTALVGLQSCELEYDPTDQITPEKLVNMPGGLQNIANGNYSMLKDVLTFNGVQNQNYSYMRQYFFLTEFASDNVTCGQVTTDPFYLSFSRQLTPSQENTSYFWYVSYKIISATNTIINVYERGELAQKTPANLQLVGENYFMRAFAHFNLLNLFAKQYAVDPDADGIVIRSSDEEPTLKARSSVKEVYNFILDDLKKASSLMAPGTMRGKAYASNWAAKALLSRVYLYMNEPDSVLKYAGEVIENGPYSIEADYPNYFRNAPTSLETIWCVQYTIADDLKKFGSIASMYYSDGNSGWGEEYASDSYRELVEEFLEDTRNQYVVPLSDGMGGVQQKTGTGIKIYYVSKFSFQDGSPTLSSPAMLRISEIYLNRAEANALKGNNALALDDLDAIREKRGLSGAALYDGVVPGGMTLLETVLKERRLELAFEGHRTFDLYRHKLDLNRSYWGYHLPGLKESDVDYTKPAPENIVSWSDPRNIYYIPEYETRINTLCKQNP
ncbi:MAG: RagB/SusD family nutrient uptake outer membrane protein [Bacteroidales bacterium]